MEERFRAVTEFERKKSSFWEGAKALTREQGELLFLRRRDDIVNQIIIALLLVGRNNKALLQAAPVRLRVVLVLHERRRTGCVS